MRVDTVIKLSREEIVALIVKTYGLELRNEKITLSSTGIVISTTKIETRIDTKKGKKNGRN